MIDDVMDPPARRSIRTRYKNILFRSKLEADWARAFDVMGLEWKYENEGRYFGDVFYLPDFYLPRSRQYVEVKGVFEPNDVRKIRALIEHLPRRRFTNDDTPDIPLIACVPGGEFYGWRRGLDTSTWSDFVMRSAVKVSAFHCSRCNGWWFAVESDGWGCQCCGASDGNSHIANELSSPLAGFPDLSRLRDTCMG